MTYLCKSLFMANWGREDAPEMGGRGGEQSKKWQLH